jgi:UDP-N-acetylglucosamine diphosphorylase / glucose-1-phosphate thymidylyltransferase / UDP-N-acetylgalactosamine diphosphorylase / glucosamine-1-phosphate N-acetyltransferase / galactosamine-1-phosphate N-acetyltransferase
MSALVLYDDVVARAFEPFALTRPVSELRAGALLVRQRWEHVLGVPSEGIIAAAHLADYEEPGAPPVLAGALPAGTILVNSRCLAALEPLETDAVLWRCRGRVAAVRLSRDVPPSALASGTLSLDELGGSDAPAAELHGWWLDAVWDLVRHLAEMLSSDVGALTLTVDTEDPRDLTRLGDHPVCIEHGASVEPLVVFDATAGPILVRRGATIRAFSRLEGPCFIGPDTIVAGGRVATSAIGDHCRVHGEVSTSIFVGHANKAHDGFLGHSVLGRWVNLGASTVTSNLKNTYGTVALWTPDGVTDTGLQFLGTLLGDHAKTAIGTRLTTGTVVGAGANVFGGEVPKVVPPFAWGASGAESYDIAKFLTMADRAMARRHVTLGESARRQLQAAHEHRQNHRWAT